MSLLPRCLSACGALIALAAASLPAQNMLRYRPSAGLPLRERPLPSRAWNGSGPGLFRPNMSMPARPFLGHPYGAITIDSSTGLIFSSNGQTSIERTFYERIGSSPGGSLPSLPLPFGVSRVYGMTFDPAARHLFLTDGTTIFEVDPAAGMAVLSAFPASPLNILAGLSYDPADPAHVYGVSTAGEVAVYSRTGGLVSVAPAPYPWPGADAVGLMLYKTEAARRDFFVLHGNGQILNHRTGVMIHDGLSDQVGIAYLPSPVILPSGSTCGGVSAEVRTSTLVVAGLAGFGLEVDGLPAGTPFAGWAVDVLSPAAPGAPTLSPIATPFGADTWLSSIVGSTAVPVSGGAAVAPLALPGGAAFLGYSLVAQPVLPCGASPLGVTLGDAMHLEISSG